VDPRICSAATSRKSWSKPGASRFPNLPYKQSDLAPITMLATVENVLVVNPSLPARNMAELVALAKAKPGSISYASPGAGAQAHLLGEMLSAEAGVQLLHVPYKGIGPALNDLLGGQVSMMFPQTSSALQYIQAGKLRAIGVTSLKKVLADANSTRDGLTDLTGSDDDDDIAHDYFSTCGTQGRTSARALRSISPPQSRTTSRSMARARSTVSSRIE
jgi:hypothetical protein